MTKSKINWDDARVLDESLTGFGAFFRAAQAIKETAEPLTSAQQLLWTEAERTFVAALAEMCIVLRNFEIVLPRMNTPIREFSPETKKHLGLVDEHQWEKDVAADYDAVNADLKRQKRPPTTGGHEV